MSDSERSAPSPWVAFGVLGLTTASHTLAETARDAVFLATVPATRLPWMYAAVGLAALLTLRGLRELDSRFRPGVIFALTAGAGAVLYGVLFLALRAGDEMWQLVLMYIVTSVLGSVLVVLFWSITTSSSDLRTAKKQFAFIGAGSVAGAIAGSGIAAGLAMVLPARGLLLGAAVGMVLASVLALVGLGAGQVTRSDGPPSFGDGVAAFRRHPYPRYVAAIVVLAAMGFTLSDYVFKATVANSVSADALAPTFALIYLGLNVGSLIVQVALVGPIVNRLTLNSVSAVTPILTGVAALGVAVSSSLGAAIGLRAVDGLFKHTLHRTGVELLYVPMRESVRPAVKRLIDVLGHRGGQVAASAGVLTVVALGGSNQLLAIGLLVVVGAWVAVAWAMREPYLDLFRDSLETTRLPDPAAADLDLQSVEALLTALNSHDPSTVRAALELLFEQGKGLLVPALILYHPDEGVVTRAAGLFAAHQRTDALAVIETVIERAGSAANLAALVRARVFLKPEVQYVRQLFAADRPGARAVAAAELLSRDDVSSDERRAVADASLRYPTACQLELLRTVALHSEQVSMNDCLRDVLVQLSLQPAPVGAAALDAIGVTDDVACVPIVVDALGRRDVVVNARHVLAHFAAQAVPHCVSRLSDEATPIEVRMELPRALADMGPLAISALRSQLLKEPTGSIAYRVLLALERAIEQWPRARLRESDVEPLVRRYIEMADNYAGYRAILETEAEQNQDLNTRAHPLLVRILDEKRLHSVQRAVRAYGLTTRSEDFRSISAGLGSLNPRQTASSLELLEATVTAAYRDLARAAARHVAGTARAAPDLGYLAVLDVMASDQSATVRELAAAQHALLSHGGVA